MELKLKAQKLLTTKLYKYNIVRVNKKTSKHIELAGTATVGPKGQVVIPYEVRRRMGIEPGSKLVALYIPERQSVGFITEDSMQTIINKMGGSFDKLSTLTAED